MSFLSDIFSGASDKANAAQIYQPGNASLQETQNQQQAFANSLQAQARGLGGPSAAQNMLHNAQEQNVSQANAMAASQQGNVNPGLASRNASMVAAQNNQALAGQGAQMRAQEQLNAQGQLGGQLGTMMGQGLAAQGANQQASIANAERSSKSGAGLLGGISSAIMGGMSGGAAAHGGMISAYEGGGKVAAADSTTASSPFLTALGKSMKAMQPAASKDPIYAGSNDFGTALGTALKKGGSMIADYLSDAPAAASPAAGASMAPAQDSEPVYTSSLTRDAGPMARGGEVIKAANGMLVKKQMPPMKKVQAIVSPGEGYLSPKQVDDVMKGADPIRVAHKVPGKASVKGDSLKNDTVPASLEEGGVVIPRTKMMSPEKAAAFVRRAVSKKGMK